MTCIDVCIKIKIACTESRKPNKNFVFHRKRTVCLKYFFSIFVLSQIKKVGTIHNTKVSHSILQTKGICKSLLNESYYLQKL